MEKLVKLPFINDLDESMRLGHGFIHVILGPRQVGKTTTLLKHIEDYYKDSSTYYSADQVFNSSSQWILEICLKAQEQKKMIVIDEIQKCDNWAEVIKKIYDQSKIEKKEFNCILLGSSSLQLQKGLTESLTGRFKLISAYHWNYQESMMGYQLTFEEYLKYGGYPGSYVFKKNKEWSDYVKTSIISTVIEKDILLYNHVKSPALFKQAFDILMAYPAQEISYTKLLGQLQEKGNTELIKYYITLYEGAFLIKALEKFSTNTIKVKSSSPKILPLSPCLYYLTILDEYTAEERGRVFELLVGSQLVRTRESLYYWREGKFEVDFILKRGKKIWAIEVKSGRKKNVKGLTIFKEKFPQAKLVIIDSENYFEFEKNPLDFLEKI